MPRLSVGLAVFASAALLAGGACRTPSGGGPDGDAESDAGSDADLDARRPAPEADADQDEGPADSGVSQRALTSVQPNHGPWVGGTEAVVRGRGFVEGVSVEVDGRAVSGADLVAIDDNRLGIATPVGRPGPADVRVFWPDGASVTLEGGFYYDSWYVDPESGSTAGGTLVRLVGSDEAGFEAGSEVTFGGQPATDVEVVSGLEILCRTPPGPAGQADVVVEGVGGSQIVRGGFLYYDSTDPLSGGLGGGAIDGSLYVTVLDAISREALPGSHVLLGLEGDTPFQGYTDDNGQITFSDESLEGRQTVTASHEPIMIHDDDGEPLGEMTFESTTILAFDAAEVTIFLLPIPPPQPGPPPPGRQGGYIAGELLFEHGGEFGPYEWQIVPEPTPPDEVKVAFVYTTHSSIWTDRLAPGSGGTVYDTEEHRGANGYIFRVYSRAAAVAVYAFAGILNTTTNHFQPYAMGVARGVVVGPGETVTGVQVYMTRQMTTTLSVVLDDPPLPDESQTPNTYLLESYLDLGAEGVISRPETEIRTDDPYRPMSFAGWTDLSGNLADASYTVVAGAWTVRPGSTDEGNPWSVRIVEGITSLDDDLVIDGFLGVPRAVSPPPGEVMEGRHMEWRAEGASPDFTVVYLMEPGGLMPLPYWFVVLPGGETSYDLPDLTAITDMPPMPVGDVSWQIWSFSVPDFDYDSWSYRYLASRYWSAYAVDSWYIRLSEG